MSPSIDFLFESFFAGYSSIEALLGQRCQFGFGQIEPTAVLGCVVNFKAFNQATGFLWLEGLVQRTHFVCVQVVHHKDNFVGVGIQLVDELLDYVSKVDFGSPISNFNMPPPCQRFK